MPLPNRRMLLAAALAAALAGVGLVRTAGAQSVEVYKDAFCGCCSLWIEHLQKNGMSVAAHNVEQEQLAKLKATPGVGKKLASCHTAKVGGYVIEGHVPAADIQRLLKEKPDAVGLAVPGMPIGSPGMEQGDRKEPYEVLLVLKDGSTRVWARY